MKTVDNRRRGGLVYAGEITKNQKINLKKLVSPKTLSLLEEPDYESERYKRIKLLNQITKFDRVFDENDPGID